MAQSIYSQVDSNVRKTWMFMSLFLVLVIAVGYFIAYIYDSLEILYFAIFFALIMNILSYWYSDKIILSLHKAKPVTREEYFDLWNITENLAITAGLPMPRLYIVDDQAPNAFATGRDNAHAVICVTTGLLAILNKTELEGVVAHELSHIGNKDILLSTVVVVLAGFVSILSHIFVRGRMFGGGRSGRGGGNILTIIGALLVVLAPIFTIFIQLAISRKREFLADASGALLTRYPDGLASALQKISASPQSLRTANNADAHLFIASPFGSKNRVSKLFMTHPPVEERIQALMGVENHVS